MISRLRKRLPAGTRAPLRNPLLHYELAKARGRPAGPGFALQLTALIALLGLSAALYAAALGAPDAGNFSARLWQSLYFPALALQACALMLALALGAGPLDGGTEDPPEENLEAPEAGPQLDAAPWDAADVFQSLNQDTDTRSGLPTAIALRTQPLGFETRVLSLDVGPSSVQYFSLASAPGAPGLSLSLETAGGTPAGETAEPLITIVRTK